MLSCTETPEAISVESVTVMASGQPSTCVVGSSFDKVNRNSSYGHRDSCAI